MRASGEFAIDFAKGLLSLTPPELLTPGLTERLTYRVAVRYPVRVKTLQHKAAALVRNLLRFRESYGKDGLMLTVYCKFVERILENPRITAYLKREHADPLHALRLTVFKGKGRRTQVRRRSVTIKQQY